jgi:hypothetical protein
MLIAGPNPSPGSSGQVLALVATASAGSLTAELDRLGYHSTMTDDPYAALIELLDRPLVYRALVVSLPSLYREELSIIRTVRAKLPHIDVLLAHTDGRQAALAEAMRLGATALLSNEAVHRLADVNPAPAGEVSRPAMEESQPPPIDDGPDELEPLLTAEELRALLQEQPTLPES